MNIEIITLRNLLEKNEKDRKLMVSIISHDLVEPLRMISSYVQLIEKHNKGKLDRDTDDFIDFAVEGASKMKQTIEDILYYLKLDMDHPEIEVINCSRIIKDTLIKLGKVYDMKGIDFEIGILPDLEADKIQMEKLFYYLIESIILSNKNINKHINISHNEIKSDYLFLISDENIPFYSDEIKNTNEGSEEHNNDNGYLPPSRIRWEVSRKILENLGGKLWIETSKDNGCKIFLQFPISNIRR